LSDSAALLGVRFAASLTVAGPDGTNTQTKAGLIIVSATTPAAPVAGFAAATLSGPAPFAVSFSNSSTSNITSYAWNFGDGTSSTVALPTHSYAVPGNYSVGLTVTGPGGSNTMTRSAYITASAVAPPPVGATSLWASTVVPSTASAYDPSSVELGITFRSDVGGKIKGIRFYKGSSNTGTHIGSLWTSTGTLLGRATFTAETASGWQQVNFATPIAITANTVYVASYHASSGYYADTSGFFATKGIDNAPLHASAGANGVYKYGTSPGFPNASYQSSNYWVDVVFAPN
jgi:PKD repeat protein